MNTSEYIESLCTFLSDSFRIGSTYNRDLLNSIVSDNIEPTKDRRGWFAVPNWGKHPRLSFKDDYHAYMDTLLATERGRSFVEKLWMSIGENDRKFYRPFIYQHNATNYFFTKQFEDQGNPDIAILSLRWMPHLWTGNVAVVQLAQWAFPEGCL